MPGERRFLLGYGERLTERVVPAAGGSPKELPYSFEAAIARLAPMAAATSRTLDLLPESACPEGEAVGTVTLHPQWIAKSYHPQHLLNEFNLRHVGSRPTEIIPSSWTKKVQPTLSPTTELFVAGQRESFRRFAAELRQGGRNLSSTSREQVRRLERIRPPQQTERLRNITSDDAESDILLEVVLHLNSDPHYQYILTAFQDYVTSLGAEARFNRRLHAGGLCFLPVQTPVEMIGQIAQFSFLRVARPVPRMRGVAPIERATPLPDESPSPLPIEDPVDDGLRVAVFDGGFNVSGPLAKWVRSHDTPGLGDASSGGINHGNSVTSALLFGDLTPGKTAPRPYAWVDHYRVLDVDGPQDPLDLYDVLRRIKDVLDDRRYEFFNLSLGPCISIEDDEVHLWTAILDEHLSDGHAFATIAAGNNGLDADNRIQVPSDCVNAVAVGATDSSRDGWKRAPYSAVGPGRSPGRVKPDVVTFGGDARERFYVYDQTTAPTLAATCGTSFASPAVLRMAVGVRAHFGDRLSPLALKALLVQSADDYQIARPEVGWGRISDEIEDLVVCNEGVVRVVYQGMLTASQYLRALVPLPNDPLQGNVDVTATFCYATPVDPQDPGNYTRSGLEVTFRPHAKKFSEPTSTEAKPRPFFKRTDFDEESTLRTDAQKWETSLHAHHRMRGASLYKPVFDIHYNARTSGGSAVGARDMRYALIVTVHSQRTPDIYDRVLRSFAGQLEAIVPQFEIPLRV
jgi:subtilase family protein